MPSIIRRGKGIDSYGRAGLQHAGRRYEMDEAEGSDGLAEIPDEWRGDVDETSVLSKTKHGKSNVRSSPSLPALKRGVEHFAIRSQSLPPDRPLETAISRGFWYKPIATNLQRNGKVASVVEPNPAVFDTKLRASRSMNLETMNIKQRRLAIKNSLSEVGIGSPTSIHHNPYSLKLSTDLEDQSSLLSSPAASPISPPTIDTLAIRLRGHGNQRTDTSASDANKSRHRVTQGGVGKHYEISGSKRSKDKFTDGRRHSNGSQPFPRQKRSRPIDVRSDRFRYPCVYHRFGRVDDTHDCSKRKDYISQLRRHHERHCFYYCVKCFSRFEDAAERSAHVDSDICLYRCVTERCGNYGQIPQLEGESLPCSHGRENSQRDQWRYLFRLARPGEEVPDPHMDTTMDAIAQKPLPEFHPPLPAPSDALYLESDEPFSPANDQVIGTIPIGGREIRPRTDSTLSTLPPAPPAPVTELTALARQITDLTGRLERDQSLLDDRSTQMMEWIGQHIRLGVQQLSQIQDNMEQRTGLRQHLSPLSVNTDLRRRSSSLRSRPSADTRHGLPISPASANLNSYLQPGIHTSNPSPIATGSMVDFHSRSVSPASRNEQGTLEADFTSIPIDIDDTGAQPTDQFPEIHVMSPGHDTVGMESSSALDDFKHDLDIM